VAAIRAKGNGRGFRRGRGRCAAHRRAGAGGTVAVGPCAFGALAKPTPLHSSASVGLPHCLRVHPSPRFARYAAAGAGACEGRARGGCARVRSRSRARCAAQPHGHRPPRGRAAALGDGDGQACGRRRRARARGGMPRSRRGAGAARLLALPPPPHGPRQPHIRAKRLRCAGGSGGEFDCEACCGAAGSDH
jgi:hypothetical protein